MTLCDAGGATMYLYYCSSIRIDFCQLALSNFRRKKKSQKQSRAKQNNRIHQSRFEPKRNRPQGWQSIADPQSNLLCKYGTRYGYSVLGANGMLFVLPLRSGFHHDPIQIVYCCIFRSLKWSGMAFATSSSLTLGMSCGMWWRWSRGYKAIQVSRVEPASPARYVHVGDAEIALHDTRGGRGTKHRLRQCSEDRPPFLAVRASVGNTVQDPLLLVNLRGGATNIPAID